MKLKERMAKKHAEPNYEVGKNTWGAIAESAYIKGFEAAIELAASTGCCGKTRGCCSACTVVIQQLGEQEGGEDE